MAGENLAVLLQGHCIGALLRTRNGARFQFAEDACKRSGSPLLSVALPAQAEPFDAERTKNWFSGLLPEDARLDEIRRFFGIEGDDYLAVLEEIGWECAGSVAVLPEERVENFLEPDEAAKVRPVDAAELAQRLSSLPSHPYDDARTLRVSLGGFQEKLCVVAQKGWSNSNDGKLATAVGIPLDGSPSTHILKPQPSRFPGMIEGEAWAMLAASCATPTANTFLLQLDGAPLTLVVERFDRKVVQGEIHRIHQEDCAQALGISPLRKYAAESSPKKSDPTFRGIAKLLATYSADALRQMDRLMEQMVVNVVLGNTDAHAKNYALLHPDNATVELSPLYDVVPASEITPGVTSMGLRIDGRIKLERVERASILAEASSWGLPLANARRILDDTLEALREGIRKASDVYPQAGTCHSEAALIRMAKLL